MAFHPNYPTDPRVYLFYTGTATGVGLVDRVSQFRLASNGTSLDPTTELELFNVDDPETNHNGGNIAFGPDGFLYIGIGDGGSGGDPHGTIGNGQNLRTLLGKVLRIDVSAASTTTTYTIPPGNPYVGNARCNANGTGRGELPRDLCLRFPQSVALELRSRQRPALAERRRAGRARGSEPRDPGRQLRLAVLRRHQRISSALRTDLWS